MLSEDFVNVYQKLHDGSVPPAISNGVPYRLEEVNNYFNGGALDVSDTFASALWGLDFLHWWASHDAAGVNFHTGDRVAAGANLQPSKYTAFFSMTNGYAVRPLGYGIEAFALGSKGKLVPVKVSGEGNVNLTAYGMLASDKSLVLTLINKEHGAGPRAVVANVATDQAYAKADTLFLRSREDDVASKSGIELGDATIERDGIWNGDGYR